VRTLTLRVPTVLAVLLALAVPAGAGTEALEPRSFTIAMTGDILITETVRRVADAHVPGYRTHDFEPMLRHVEPWIADADFAICHLETPLLPPGSGIRKAPTGLPFPQFSAPAELADGLVAVGYDACSTAANHALDYGFEGLTATLDVLDAAGLGHSGTSRSEAEDRPALYDVNGVTVAHAAYTFGTNKILPGRRGHAGRRGLGPGAGGRVRPVQRPLGQGLRGDALRAATGARPPADGVG
jgi:poly-gamma-glutamate synthesis protein (capsule biosynthesis protein)